MSVKDKRTPNSPLKSLTLSVVVLSALVLYLLPQTTILNSRLLLIRQQLFRSFGTMAKVAPPRPIKLYSNSNCPFAARSRFALAEANVDFEEVEIDLQNKPEWYLKIFPAGKVPAMDFGGEMVIESNVISEFVADLFPQAHLRPEGNSADSALKAAKMRQFVEVWQSKVQSSIFAPIFGSGDPDASKKIINGLKNDVVPLLQEYKGPYVLGKEISMADVLTHSFLLRLFAFAKAGFYGEGVYEQLESIKEVKEWHDALEARESVKKTWNEKSVVDGIKKFLEKKK